MNQIAKIGDNFPPSPIDTATAPFADAIAESENWLDGTKVENEAQLAQVDALLADIKAAIKAVTAGEESEAKPLHDQWKAAKERWKPTITDLDRIKKGLIAVADGFKRRLAAEKAEKARLAQEAAAAALRAAQEASAKADPTNLESQRAAEQAQAVAKTAKFQASAANKDTVKGLRTVQRYEITDHRAALHWIIANNRPAMVEFIEEYVRRNHTGMPIDGVRTWAEKVAV